MSHEMENPQTGGNPGVSNHQERESTGNTPILTPATAQSPVFRGYTSVFRAYRTAGWECVLPLSHGKKSPPPTGYTGREARTPSYPDLYSWAEEYPDGNVCLRLPSNVIGIDVDHYDGKDGGGTLQRHIDQFGPLPATWRTGSRTDGVSGIRLFRVPEGLQWPGDLGGGIEIIQSRHRYAIVGPSRHPNGGTYRWSHDVLPSPTDFVPGPADLAELPEAWVAGLTGGLAAKNIQAVGLTHPEAETWLKAHGVGTPCRQVENAVNAYINELSTNARSRHEVGKDATMRLARMAAEGHGGTYEALTQVRTAFLQALDGDPRATEGPEEFNRLLLGAVRIAAVGSAESGDPCLNPFHGILSFDDYEAAVPDLPTTAPTADHAGAAGLTPPTAEDSRTRFPVLDWAARWDTPVEQEWIVEPLLPARRLVSLYSPPKTGKSLLMLEIAASVASGREVLGVTPTRRGVLYVDFENDPDADIIPRLKAMGFVPGDLSGLDYLSFPTMGTLDSERGALDLIAALDLYGSEVVVIDTVSRAVAGVENENDTWLNFYRHTGLKLKQRGIALIRLDHSGKDETKGQRGGSAKSGDVDAVWRLSTVVQDETFRLECEMARMQVAEKSLILHRLTTPTLRHKVDASGPSAAFKAGVSAVVEAMDADGLPNDAGRTAARKSKEGHSLRAGTKVLEEAVRVRQQRDGHPLQLLLEEP